MTADVAPRQRRPRWQFLVAATGIVAVVVPLLVAMLGGRSVSAAAAGEALASLDVLEAVVDWRDGPDGAWVATDAGGPLDAGDGIRTDQTGLARVDFADGSLTRLDSGTEMQLQRLDGNALAPQVTVRLDIGRVYNRVQHVTGQVGSFEVETAVGTAAVRGTAFMVECLVRNVCTFTVVDGVVVVTTPDGREFVLNAGDSLTLGPDGLEAPAGSVADGGPGGPPPGPLGGDGAGDGGDADGSGSGDGDADGGVGGDSGDGGSGDGGDGGSGDGATGTDGGSGGDGSGAQVEGAQIGADGLVEGFVVELAQTLDRSVPDLLDQAPWLDDQASQDDDLGRYGAQREACAVTVDGRNVDFADSPTTAIEVPVDDVLDVRAIATGPLETYEVQLRLAGMSVTAASGEVQPDASGNRSGFAGTIDVSDYARWGVGLYEVVASTTGTECSLVAYVDVVGAPPFTSAAGLLATLLAIGGLAGILAAISQALSFGSVSTSTTEVLR